MIEDKLEVFGAREHNLKDINLSIPRNKLVVITGLSGSGKSSLAFDTIYAEGQRRYIESFSAYARQFLGSLERPDVDKITGLSPVISIEQKTVNKNPRSTVGTITEIYDFLRLLYARIGDAYSYVSGKKMVKYSDQQILDLIIKKYKGKAVSVLAPVVKGRKGHYRELFEQIRRQGFIKTRINGDITDLKYGLQLDRYKTHDIEIVIDRLEVREKDLNRIKDAISLAMFHGKGSLMILDQQTDQVSHFSRSLMCPESGISYDEPAPNTFSFNSPYGACNLCNGLGTIPVVNRDKLIPNPSNSIKKGGIAPIGPYKNTWMFKQLESIAEKYGFSLSDPINLIPEEAVKVIINGTDEILKIKNKSNTGVNYTLKFEGIASFIESQYKDPPSPAIRRWAREYMSRISCPDCQGKRLKKESLHFFIDGKNISDLTAMSLDQLKVWLKELDGKLNPRKQKIATEPLKEIRTRTQFLLDIGLEYLTLDRTSRTLSGGEAQRIRLATQIGSQLVNVLYILDEPSIGLHQRDNQRLIESLRQLRDIGNSVIVVEHDKDMILAADHIVDIGPGAGEHGGKIVSEGAPKTVLQTSSLTASYLNGSKNIEIPAKRRIGNAKILTLKNASGNNLKNITVSFPLGKLICVTGVSGSGKSTLINETLYPILSQYFYKSHKKPLAYNSIEGIGNVDKVIEIDQSPIGRTPRSNPATYIGVFSFIRALYTNLPEAKIRGYQPGRFSFNVKGGRCETCKGGGMKTIEMNFLPDIYVECETCNGKRYNRETLEIRYKGKNISDVLNMTVEHALHFFENIPSITNKLHALYDVGLGYITLGQPSTTLSGGEAQRVKLAAELSRKDTGNTFYIFDEPTTGLHFEDIRILMEVLNKLVDKGNTIVIIEHNMDVIKMADHIIDIGPEGGDNGGQIVFQGSPEQIIRAANSYTGKFLKSEMKQVANQPSLSH